jgi:hypothetical protein
MTCRGARWGLGVYAQQAVFLRKLLVTYLMLLLWSVQYTASTPAVSWLCAVLALARVRLQATVSVLRTACMALLPRGCCRSQALPLWQAGQGNKGCECRLLVPGC